MDIEVPESIHDKVSDYPLFPEKIEGKLLTTLHPKERYITHSSTIEMGLRVGYKFTKVHRVLRYISTPWLRPYIDRNTELRKKAKSKFEKDLYKLGSNAIFGRTLMNVRNRIVVKFADTEKEFNRLWHKPHFRNMVELETNKELTLVEMAPMKTLKLDQPIYCGLAILDRSKVHMQGFYYDYVQEKFAGRNRLLMTDTDSLFLEIVTPDFYEEIAPDVHELFDTSDLPATLSTTIEVGVNKKVPGLFKDESGGTPILEFAGVGPKQYSYRSRSETTMKCKGITKPTLRGITFEDYKKALDPKTKTSRRDMWTIRSRKHTIHTEIVNKVVFNPKGVVTNKPKRKVLDDNIHTLPWGHYSLRGDST